ncbi:Fumarylacetoacetase [Neonectria ditissima]|uniref:Fumarylacetoacetase n=1 Tax=Neonectria ditissima TaxID=78410 RepID=A0A0P7ATX8_9HYPO|nr:Fumarylacetoacetase [Neonectria ditissima]
MSEESWFDIPSGSDFSLINFPFGIISHPELPARHPAVAIGSHALDLQVFAQGGGFSDLPELLPVLEVFHQETLNDFAQLGRPLHAKVREYLRLVFLRDTPFANRLRDNKDLQAKALIPLSRVQMHLPLRVGDYTDFYAGKHHAYNVGVLFRGAANAFQPNYTHLPVGYHGRASSVVVSGTPVRRPWGQILDENKSPIYHPSKRLDIELELGAFICKGNALGSPVPISQAEEYIFGYVLMNDWSARDIQAWEYVPLGPFNSKNFATSVSPWVVLADALEPFRTEGIENETQLQSYLKPQSSNEAFNIDLEVSIQAQPSQEASIITRSNARHLLWSFPQMIAHHTVGGCPMNVGDLLGSGTISGPDAGSRGSLLELSEGGTRKVEISGGSRTFLADGDDVVIRGWCTNEAGDRLGFGECRGQIIEALSQ